MSVAGQPTARRGCLRRAYRRVGGVDAFTGRLGEAERNRPGSRSAVAAPSVPLCDLGQAGGDGVLIAAELGRKLLDGGALSVPASKLRIVFRFPPLV